MNRWFRIIKKIVKEDTKVLGRWTITYCDKQIDYKMLWTSQDYINEIKVKKEKPLSINQEIRLRYMV